MGSGSYSVEARAFRSESLGYATKSSAEIFTALAVNNSMNPHGVSMRESRDSAEHPNSLALVLALDVTGSMGSVPRHLVKEGLPTIMGTIIQRGILDPQLLFLGIGDHECDSAPLQVGQFESSDELLDKWLTNIYMEGGGGGNPGESYLLAWYFAARHTAIDCLEKRGKKGLLFTIGDEPCLKSVPGSSLSHLMGPGQYSAQNSSDDLLEAAKEKYDCFHLHIRETSQGSRDSTVAGWKQLMGDNLIVVGSHRDVPRIIVDVITRREASSLQPNVKIATEEIKVADTSEEML